MNLDMNDEKKIEILPLPEQVKSKKPVGRPKDPNKKPRVEIHALTPARKAALEKGRVVKAENLKIRKAEKARKEMEEKEQFKLFQASLTAQANKNQGHHFNPSIDPDQSLRQSSVPAQAETGGVPYVTPNSYTLTPDSSAQVDRMTRIETLLTSFLSSQNMPSHTPQNPVVAPTGGIAPHHSSVFNSNPYLARRYKK